jgi:MYXO-CTERM domain-containing protein
MAHNRTKQRGVIQLATSVMLAAMGALLSVTGCASDVDTGSGGGERLGRVGQALCGTGPNCPEDSECGTWTCTKLNGGTCVPMPGAKDGERCGLKSTGLAGVCVKSACCTGCTELDRLTGEVTCHQAGTAKAFCGGEGVACDNCNTGNSCLVGSCEPNKRVCVTDAIPDKEPCSGENGACWQGKCCTGCIDGSDSCVAGTTVNKCGLSSTNSSLVSCRSCDDGNVCNNDACVNGVCAAPTPKAGACSDGNVCTVNDQCNAGQCAPGAMQNCNDNNPCTEDKCDAIQGCIHPPVEAGTSCDADANKCNGTAKCEGTVCKPIAAVDCDDNNICTTDGCTPATGACVHTNNTLDCSDNNLCTVTDKCSGGACVGTGTPNCNDNEPCTTDSCAAGTGPGKGCVHTPVQNNMGCDDGNACSTGDSCQGGKCLSSGGLACDDNNVCTQNSCSVANQMCLFPDETNNTPCVFDKCHQNSTCQGGDCAAGEVIDCDDNNICTTDSCDPATGCKHVNVDGGDCSDNDLCTTADKCAAGKCVGAAVVCTALDDCHEAGTCNPNSGSCDDPRAADDTACDDGSGTCQAGKCEPNPGSGGAGGEPGAAGAGTGGSVVAAGGEPGMPMGGEGNEPGAGGAPTEPNGGKGATTSMGGTDSQNGGEGIDPEHVFVRDPGGCSCSLPSGQGPKALWLAGLALVAALARRRRAAAGSGPAAGGQRS